VYAIQNIIPAILQQNATRQDVQTMAHDQRRLHHDATNMDTDMMDTTAFSPCAHETACQTSNDEFVVSARRCKAPRGCAVGIPMVRGTPAAPVPNDTKGLFRLTMQFVQEDDYNGLMQLARYGLASAFNETKKCGFSCDITPGAATCFEGQVMLDGPMEVRGASLLHYAVSIGSFQAGSALLVICPAMLKTTCAVSLSCMGESPGRCWQARWTPLEMAEFFCNLYSEDPELDMQAEDMEGMAARVRETRGVYWQARAVLQVAEQCPERFPYLALPCVRDRVDAAGPDAEYVLQSLCAVVFRSSGFGCGPAPACSWRLAAAG